jgi:hypothetical protein
MFALLNEQRNEEAAITGAWSVYSHNFFITWDRFTCMGRHLIMIILLLLFSGCTGDDKNIPEEPTVDINSFEECIAAGYPVMESYPLQCRTPDGMTFVEELDEPIKPPDTEAPAEERHILEVDVVYQSDGTPEPSWLVVGPDMKNPPWEGAVYMARSNDGLTFTGEKLFVDRAGVPNLLLTKDSKLVATFQYFSYLHEELFDVIAYTVSDDFGETWSPVRKIKIEGKGFEKVGAGGPNPVDPTLVQLDDGPFRLYFTFHPPGQQYPGLFSARSDGLDGAFKSEGLQLEVTRMILDPAVVEFNGKWHHYTVLHGEKTGSKYINVHSVSDDGQNFEVAEDIPFDFQFLGQVIEDGGKLRFYGSGDGIKSATSTDGYSWTKDSGKRSEGADPGVAKLPDGTYILIYTKVGGS